MVQGDVPLRDSTYTIAKHGSLAFEKTAEEKLLSFPLLFSLEADDMTTYQMCSTVPGGQEQSGL